MVLPVQYLATMASTYMPIITASIGSETYSNYYIDNNSQITTAWITGCTMESNLTTTTSSSCTAAPVLATDALNTNTLSGGVPYSTTAGGYYTEGYLYDFESLYIETLAGSIETG